MFLRNLKRKKFKEIKVQIIYENFYRIKKEKILIQIMIKDKTKNISNNLYKQPYKKYINDNNNYIL